MNAPVYISHPATLDHDTGQHPERADRIRAIEARLERVGWHGFERVEAPTVERELLEYVHFREYVVAVEAYCERGGGAIDADTIVVPGSWEAALRSAGGAVELVERLLNRTAASGFSAGRPPGHHAKQGRAMGFCLFNNVALAASHALRAHGLERVLILDWDVHHGNGTNDIFARSASVLYVSIHQAGLFPGTGEVSDHGKDEGTGYTLNLPVPPNSGDEVFCGLVDLRIVPLARQFEPQLVLVSAGYDAHAEDPLADCLVTDDGYAQMTASLRDLCAELDVPLGFVLEGGYALDALARSVDVTLAELAKGR
ncbi:MAG: histone deacetylase [Solirubrobacteraceae bacterium]